MRKDWTKYADKHRGLHWLQEVREICPQGNYPHYFPLWVPRQVGWDSVHFSLFLALPSHLFRRSGKWECQHATWGLWTVDFPQPIFIPKKVCSAKDPSSWFHLNNLACPGRTCSHQAWIKWCVSGRGRIKILLLVSSCPPSNTQLDSDILLGEGCTPKAIWQDRFFLLFCFPWELLGQDRPCLSHKEMIVASLDSLL